MQQLLSDLLLGFITYETKKKCQTLFNLVQTKRHHKWPMATTPPLWVVELVKIALSTQHVCQETSELCCTDWLLFSSPAVVLSVLSKSTHRLSSVRPRAAECLQRFASQTGFRLSLFSAGCVTHRQPEYRSSSPVLRESDCRINERMNLLYWLQHIQHILTEPELDSQ